MSCKKYVNSRVSLMSITIVGCIALFSPTMVEAQPYNLYVYPEKLDASQGGVTNPVSVWTMADYLANLPYVVNTPLVVIAAEPTNGYVFSSWEKVAGDPSVMIIDTNAASTIVQYTGNNDVSIRAKFRLWKLRVVLDGDGSVDQDPTPNPVDLGYTNGQVVTLTAIPNTGQAFLRWGGPVSNIYDNPTTVTMTNDTTITAYFRAAEPDQDHDNLPDWWEVQYGLNPRDPTGVNGSDGDPDNDGLSNYQEYWISYIVLSNQSVRFFANPIHADSDGDGMDDGYEFYHIGVTTNLYGTNAMAVVTPEGIYGREGNPDQDFKWNTLTGYETDVGLANYEEYVGPDMIVPGTWTNPIPVPGILLPVYAFVPNPDDTGDQSFSDTTDSEVIGGAISGDGFDDGFEWSWDVWQGVHGGEPAGDPLGHRIPDRFGSPANPLSVTVGDWNADGFLDLAVANSGHDEVTTLYGRGDGTFNSVSNAYSVQDYPRMIASGDLDGDGQADDLAVVNGGGNSISVLLGAGGIHSPATHYPVGNNPSCLVIGNFTGSADNDIAVANEGSDTVMILVGPGFVIGQTILVGTAPSSIAAGPIFGSATSPGAPIDLVVANSGSDSVTVLRNVAGVFSVFGTVTVGFAPSSVELRDFDNDSTNDLVVSCYNSSDVRGYRGNGDGTFGPETVTFLGTGRGPRNIAAGHLDRYAPPAGNTNLDVAVANELANTVSILLGSGSGVAFNLFTSIDVPNFPCWVEIADFNNDNTNDVVVVQRDSDTVQILLGYGDGRFANSGVYDVASRIVDRRFNPAGIHPNPPDFGRPDYDLCYDVDTGFVGDWYSDDLEYKAWSITNSINISTNGLMRREFPNRRRCTNPFLWDTDGDRMPDGWELAFNYDPWARKTYQLGLGNDDSEDNPDSDWMAQSGTNKHWYVCRYVPGVYASYGYTGTYFDPHTAWYYLEPPTLGWPELGANTVRFINYEELIGPRGIPALVPYDPEDNATHPRNYDTDRDGMWDGWEWYVHINGNNPVDPRRISPRNSEDAGQDYDYDGISNLEEFMSYATSTNNKAFITPLTNWLNKFYPTDPWTFDTDGDQISDGEERREFNYLIGVTQFLTIVYFTNSFTSNGQDIVEIIQGQAYYRGGGLNPTTVDTDNDYLPDYWEASFPGGGVDTNFNPVGGGMDGTFADAFEDYDGDRLLNYQEYMVGCTYHWQWSYNQDCAGGWWPGGGWGSYLQWDFFDVNTSRSPIYPWGDNMVGTGAREPKWWDEAFWAQPATRFCPAVPYRFMTAATPSRRPVPPCLPIPVMGNAQLFSTSDPSSPDTDDDGMDDYWEVYHMLNPIWGGRDLVYEKLVGTRLPPSVPSGGDNIWNYPWINGGTLTDSDGDGLPNIFESIQPNTPPAYYYHTDPTPYWLSDISDAYSWANLYYCVHPPMSCGNYWYWDRRVMTCLAMSPNYLYSFEINEGFDTDNDGYADRAELVDTTASPGSTDPIDSEDPIRHRAFYLDGVDSALRTHNQIGHGYEQFRSFAVECWVKPQAPQMGRPQIFVERTSLVPNGNPMGYPSGIRANFRLGCDDAGRAFIGYHGAGYDPIFEEAKVPPDQAFVSNIWYHVAGVYDGYGDIRTNGPFKGELRLYINGKLAAMKPTSEIPWNGWYDGNPDNPTIPQPVSITPMPIVIGAQDNNPSGWVDGSSIVKNWNLICACMGPVYAGAVCFAPNLPSPGNYFRGWIDEVRIWDGPRSQTDIQTNFRRRFTRADIIQANQTPTILPSGAPVLLVYAFGFDDARDPVVDGIVPVGFDLLPMGSNPSSYPGIEWWYTLPSGLRSSVYTDYRYVPWVENLACHLPWNPPLDSIVPWDEGDNFYPNTLNPYVWNYRTGVTFDEERNPRYHTLMIAGTGTDTNVPIYGDLLPLGNARADATVKLWEEDGKYKPFDFDGDGLPDDWETAYGLDPKDPTGVNGPDGDPDADGLSNFYEYLTGNKPMSGDSDGDGLSDALEDYDGDGLNNLAELQLGTLPHRKDTDDDGVTDWEEVTGSVDWSYDPGRPPTSRPPTRQSDPLDPLDPIVQRCAYLGNNGNARVIVPPHDKFMTTDWTVELWVRPSAGSDGGVLVSRYVQGVIPSEWGINYELGLTTNNALPGTLRLYASFRTKDGVEYRVDGLGPTEHTAGLATNAVPYDQWTHVAGTFAVASNTMSIYVNAKVVSYRMDASGVPPTVLGYFDEHWGDEVTIGASRSTGPVVNGYEGYLDEVRIWRICRTAEEIADLYNGIGTSIAAGEFRFDDGGLTAQDFSVRADWMEDWRHAAIMDGAVFATNTVPPLDKDTDGDGMPDWWEVAYGLDPTDPTGNNGAYGDPDKDELDNIYEYLAGSDPRLVDTDGDGFYDYDSMSESARASGVGRTFGEIYDDGDRIPDLWEVQYMGICPETGNRGLDPAYYDAHLDPDEDGWSNYAEFMAGTDPLTGTNYPMPTLTVHARYNGLLAPDINALLAAGGVVHLDFYRVRSMDGYPWGTLDMATNVLSTNMLTTGHLVEGALYIFGYIDRDADGQWNPDTEPAGLVEPFPVYIGWGDVNNVEIALTDKLDGYPRFRWDPPTNVIDGYELRMMQGTNEVFRRFIRGSFRSYFHEGDYLYQGRYGLGAGTYAANIFYKETIYEHVYTNYLASVIKIVDPITPSTPQFVTAEDFVYEYAKNDLIWKGSSNATAYEMNIYNSSGQLLLSVTNRIPYLDPNDNYRTVLPFYAGDNYAPGGIWINGRYTITLRAFNPSYTSAVSQRNVQLLLRDPVDGGKSKIEGDVYYFGKVQYGYPAQMPGYTTNLVIIIQTFMSPGFSGEPDAQVQLTTFASTNNYGRKGSYKLLGLHNATHYVRAFIDLNGNRKLDNFEPYGFYQRYTNAFAYESAPVDLTGGGNVAKSGIRIVIRDRDTDDDGLPDGWEWMYYGHLNYGADTLGANGLTLLQNYEASPMDLDPTKTDFDEDGLPDFFEVTYSDWIRGLPPNPKHYDPYHPVYNPNGTDLDATRADTDCDGLSDKYEVDNGLNPLNPNGDADGDGIPDAQEILVTKTSPHDASDVLFIRVSTESPFTFTWNGKSGVTYKVQYCDNLVTGTWQDAPDGIRTGTGVLSYTDNNPPVKGIRFYRVIVVQP